MSPAPAPAGEPQPTSDVFARAMERLVRFLAAVACVSLLIMVLVTTADVILRLFRLAVPGAYDLVRIATTITIAAALPYTTAVKGHVAIEYFFHKLNRRGRVIVDTVMRLLVILLFGLLAWGCVDYGNTLKTKGEVSMTLQLPVFWVPYVVAVSCGLVVLITLHHLLHPGRELIKP